MRRSKYFEEIPEFENIADLYSFVVDNYPLIINLKELNKNSLIPTYYLLKYLINRDDYPDEEISFFSRNPGIKKVIKIFAQRNKFFIVFLYKSRYYAITPRSLFIYLVENLFQEKLLYIFDKVLHHARQCFQYNTKITKIITTLLENRSNFAPICRRGKITRIISVIDIFNLYVPYRKNIDDLYVFDIKTPLFSPQKSTTYNEVIDCLKRYSYSIYVVSGEKEYFIDEVSMYETIKEIFTKGV